MKKISILKLALLTAMTLTMSSCLKTRSEVGEQDQTYTYGKKNADNQIEAKAPPVSQLNQEAPLQVAALDEKDELIRTLNGRVETLENQLAALIKDKETTNTQDSQKIVLLQEALTKMQGQIDKLENPEPAVAIKPADKNAKASGDATAVDSNVKKLNAYEAGQQYFSKQEWKKAILNFQKYTDESPKGKNVADSKYKIGICFQELGMKEEAMAFYEEVVANFSKTEAGKKSKLRLTQLTKSKK